MPPAEKNKALSAALSSSLASLLTTLLFYPLAVAKTRRQSNRATAGSTLSFIARIAASTNNSGRRRPFPATLRKLFNTPLLSWKDNYAGIDAKLLHSCTSSFLYFYISTLLAALYTRVRRREIGVLQKLALACGAACLNTAFTMPLDAAVTKRQTFGEADGNGDGEGDGDGDGGGRGEEEERGGERIGELYKGLVPALLLSLHPALHYTAYDFLKNWAFPASSSCSRSSSPSSSSRPITAAQAFLLGVLAKSFATLITYPMIRAKVILMSSPPSSLSPPSLTSTFSQILSTSGPKGLYRGMDLQLGHTVLKAAAVLAIKEKVNSACVRMVQRL